MATTVGTRKMQKRTGLTGQRFVGVFALLHAMVFAFGFMNYKLKVWITMG
jgi:hypothetical protein